MQMPVMRRVKYVNVNAPLAPRLKLSREPTFTTSYSLHHTVAPLCVHVLS